MDRRTARIDYGLLGRLTALLLCTGCLRRGRHTPVAQVVSVHHRPRTLCTACARELHQQAPATGQVLRFPLKRSDRGG